MVVPLWLVLLDNGRFSTTVVALGKGLGDFQVKSMLISMLRLGNADTSRSMFLVGGITHYQIGGLLRVRWVSLSI
jgi:hypothetical protein